MPLDINTIRAYKGGDPEKVRESQRRRFADVALVDKVIAEDEEWRRLVALADDKRGEKNAKQKEITIGSQKIGRCQTDVSKLGRHEPQ